MAKAAAPNFAITCPMPIGDRDRVMLGHGSGGKLSAQLLRDVFLPAFDNPVLNRLEDQATVNAGTARIAFTTDSFVVTPRFFPGGDIGMLAVHGTINDLAVGGARPLYLSAAFIIEEGLPIEELRRVVRSMSEAAHNAGVPVVCGDTKVVNRGSADGLFITTAGVGLVENDTNLGISQVRPGDKVLLSGTIGDHGMAVMSVREDLDIEGEILSDSAPLHDLVRTMLNVGAIHAMRDPTRGGLAATLCEISEAAQVGILIEEAQVPSRGEVRAVCELLGMDPLMVANEGKLVAFVAREDAQSVLKAMREHDLGRDAAMIGELTDRHPGMVLMKTTIGGTRVLDLPFHEQLPRIC